MHANDTDVGIDIIDNDKYTISKPLAKRDVVVILEEKRYLRSNVVKLIDIHKPVTT